VVFVDPASQHLLALAKRVAQAEVTALLVGPTGSGKEVLARVLHEYSPRAKGPFVAMNCAAMPDHLIEDMLFGHEKGAFTGAHKDHKGLFEQAQGGTLFLDEIGEMPMHLQSKLLRVLQEKQLTRLGGQQLLHLNVRIVAATNKDLRSAIASKEFREDLYYRIATFRMRLLPLNQRRGDIIPLALQFLTQQAKGHKWQIDAEAESLLLEYAWPGNVRELENVMRRAMVLCPHQTIGTAHLMFDDWVTDNAVRTDEPDTARPLSEDAPNIGSSAAMATEPAIPTPAQDLHSATRISEHQVIMATLAETTNREEAARRLGISPRTLRYKLAQFKAHGLSMAA
jgi:two-component system response regulator FlrC